MKLQRTTFSNMAGAMRSRQKQRGQALLESVLTIVAFTAMFLGMIELGEILYVHQTLVERVREATRWGAVNTWDSTNSPTQMTNIVLYGTPTPANTTTPLFGLSSSNVSVTRPQPDYSAGDRIQVVVSGYALNFLSNAMLQANSGSRTPSGQINGLTVSESQLYEVSNGSSH